MHRTKGDAEFRLGYRPALDGLRAAAATGKFAVSLLQGVTGSGKTEVYLRLADVARRIVEQQSLLEPKPDSPAAP